MRNRWKRLWIGLMIELCKRGGALSRIKTMEKSAMHRTHCCCVAILWPNGAIITAPSSCGIVNAKTTTQAISSG